MVDRVVSGRHSATQHNPATVRRCTFLEIDTMNAKLFASDPRDFALELVSEGYATADHLLLCCLKYMSTDDVRDMLDTNELSPRFNEDNDEEEICMDCGGYNISEGTCTDCERDQWLEMFDSDEYDVEAMKTDIATNNLEVGRDDHTDKYRVENIVRESITNGQLTQAKEQCDKYGLDYEMLCHEYQA